MGGFVEWCRRESALISIAVSVVGTVVSVAGLLLAVSQDSADARFRYIAYSSSGYIAALILLLFCMFVTARRDARRIEQMQAQVERERVAKETLERETIPRLQLEAQEAKETLGRLQNCFANIHQVAHDFRDAMARDDSQFVDKAFFVKALDFLKPVFDETTGQDCSLCIKVFARVDHKLSTLCRDSKSERHRGIDEYDVGYEVGKNTDFSLIMAGARRWWFSNDLPGEANYVNERANYADFYKAAVVVPIRKMSPDGQVFYEGFLCVDAPEPGAFNEGYHPYLLSAVGDMLHPLVVNHRLGLSKDQANEAREHNMGVDSSKSGSRRRR